MLIVFEFNRYKHPRAFFLSRMLIVFEFNDNKHPRAFFCRGCLLCLGSMTISIPEPRGGQPGSAKISIEGTRLSRMLIVFSKNREILKNTKKVESL